MKLQNATHIHQGLGVHNAKHPHTPKVPELGLFPSFQLEAVAALGYAIAIPLGVCFLLCAWWHLHGKAAHRRTLHRDAVAYDAAVEKLAMMARQQHLASEEGSGQSSARRERHRAMTHAAPFFEHGARLHATVYGSQSSSSGRSSPRGAFLNNNNNNKHHSHDSMSTIGARLLRDDVPRELVNDHSAGPRAVRREASTTRLGRQPSFRWRGREEQQAWPNNPADRNKHVPLQRNASVRSNISVSTIRGVRTVRGAPQPPTTYARQEGTGGIPAAMRSSLVDTSSGLQRTMSTSRGVKRSPMPPSARNAVYERAMQHAPSSSQTTLTGPSPSKRIGRGGGLEVQVTPVGVAQPRHKTSQSDFGVVSSSAHSLSRPRALYVREDPPRRGSAGSGNSTDSRPTPVASPSLVPLAPYLFNGANHEWISPLSSPGQSIDVPGSERRPHLPFTPDTRLNLL
ncbi:hypothetical protein CBOM_02705 [Ceraceosorus bombacis]|uniref:Uncharacterized protein n=1 Tax=Ceraceosorus bombacis TaxID=401625 RepID=A0A0N7L9W1_9BASI|nr:hypothetical protein CBOM_02705 [Ceraceosorus bombacis]